MADFDWPDVGMAPSSIAFYLRHNSTVFQSPFTRQRQVLGRAPAQWVARLSLRGLEHDKAAIIDAMLAKLRGQQKTVTIWDWRRPAARGDQSSFSDFAAAIGETFFDDGTGFDDTTGFVEGEGTPAMAALEAGGFEISFSGYRPATRVWRAGDYIGIAPNLYMASEDAWSDSLGNVTVPIEPPAAANVAAGSAFVTTRARVVMRLSSDESGTNPTDVNGLSVYELDFEQVL